MKIEEIYIDGFGHFRDTKLNALSPHLTVITGPNEAGKSTLLEFIRRMFFGFKKQGPNSYSPLNGGDRGGWLRLTTPTEGAVLLERSENGTEPALVSADGSPAVCTLPDLIGTADRQFFENVYAFGIGELSDFKSLSAGSIQNRVMSAGIGITRGSIADVQAQIRKDQDALFKPGKARKDIRIKEIFKDIEAREEGLRPCIGTQGDYDRLQNELEKTRDALVTLKEKDRDVRMKRQDASGMLAVWDDWVAYTETQRRLSSLPEVAAVPEDGVQTLRGLKERAGEIEEELTTCRQKLQQSTEKLAGCTVDEVVFAHADEIRDLENGLKKYLADLGAYDEAVGEREGLAEEVGALAGQVGLQGEALASFDVSARTRQKVENFRTCLSGLDEEERSQTHEVGRLDGEKREVQAGIQKDEATLSALPVTGSLAEVQKKRAALDDLSVDVPAWSKAKDDLDRLIEKEAEIGTRLKQDAAVRGVSLPRWPALVFVAAGVVALAGGVMMDSLIIGGGLFLLMLVFAGIYLRGIGSAMPADMPAGDDVLDMARVRQTKETTLAEQEAGLRKKAKECGFSTIPDLSAINTLRSGLDSEVHTLQKREGLEKALQVSRTTYAGLVADLEGVQAALAANAEKKKEMREEWQAWLHTVSLDASLTPEVVLNIVPKIEKAQDRIRARDVAETRCASLKETIAAYEEAVTRTAAALGIDPDASVEVQVQQARTALDTHLGRKRQHEALEQECAGKRDDEKVLIKRQEAVVGKRDELFSQASVADEETFLEHAQVWESRKKLLDEKARAELQLKKAAGGDRAFPAFVARLESTERTDLQEVVRACDQEMEEITPAMETKQQAVGSLKKEIEELEGDNRAAAYEAELRCLHDDLTEASRAWVVRVIADHLLHQAIKKYEKERQPAVIQEATRYFSGITGGRYQKIYRPIDAEAVVVEEGSGNRKEITDLSLGTAQQLYLALRFGYITEFGKHDAALPVVFDDVLVNFDPERKERGCRAIADLAGKTQVLYFTCHPETVELLTEARPDARVIDLSTVGGN